MLKTSVHFTISKQREDLAVLLFYRCDVVVAERVSPRQCYVLFSDDTAAFWQPERAAIVELLLFCSLHNDFSRLVFFFFSCWHSKHGCFERAFLNEAARVAFHSALYL